MNQGVDGEGGLVHRQVTLDDDAVGDGNTVLVTVAGWLGAVIRGFHEFLESTSTYIIRTMALSIKDPEADRLARELAARTGETLTEAVVVALRERLAREAGRTRTTPLCEELATIRRRCADLPVLDTRAADEVIRYDQHGLPT